MSMSLEQRIASVLGDGAITSSALGDLIAETEQAASEADATAEAERAKALDVTQPVDLTTVHAAMERAAMSAQRLRAALPRLLARLDEEMALEHDAKWRAAYDEAAIVRDNLAAKLQELYAPFVERITDLLSQIAECDEEIIRIGVNAPSGEPRRLRKVELEARNLASFTRSVPSIVETLCLPPWQPGAPEWPVHRPFSAAMAAAIAPRPFNPRYSADWHKVTAAEAEAQREQQRLETEKREAEANANWRGPKWWLGERA